MLCLSRKPNEKILIHDNITVTVVRIGPNTVRLGITAPNWMNIVRAELLANPEQLTEDRGCGLLGEVEQR